MDRLTYIEHLAHDEQQSGHPENAAMLRGLVAGHKVLEDLLPHLEEMSEWLMDGEKWKGKPYAMSHEDAVNCTEGAIERAREFLPRVREALKNTNPAIGQ